MQGQAGERVTKREALGELLGAFALGQVDDGNDAAILVTIISGKGRRAHRHPELEAAEAASVRTLVAAQ